MSHRTILPRTVVGILAAAAIAAPAASARPIETAFPPAGEHAVPATQDLRSADARDAATPATPLPPAPQSAQDARPATDRGDGGSPWLEIALLTTGGGFVLGGAYAARTRVRMPGRRVPA
jgi:hypothetical protein